MNSEPYELGLTRPARRAISEVLPEDVATAAIEFITGPLLEAPHRVGKPLRATLAGLYSARLGTQWRVVYRIDDPKRIVVVQDIQHRSTAYRRRSPAGPSHLPRLAAHADPGAEVGPGAGAPAVTGLPAPTPT